MAPSDTQLVASGELSAQRLHRLCDPASLGFSTTSDVEPFAGVLGQDEALEALHFGLSMEADGFNLFVLGLPGSGRHSFVRQAATEHAASAATPSDWCYVSNLSDPRRPRALGLPPGRAPEFAAAMNEMIAELRTSIPQALQADDVVQRRKALVSDRGDVAAEKMEEFRKSIEDDPHIALIGRPDSMTVVPARGGEPLREQAFLELPDDARKEIEAHMRAAGQRLFDVQRQVHELQRQAQQSVTEYHHEVARGLVRLRIDVLAERFADVPDVLEHLDEVATDIVDHADHFMTTGPAEEAGPLMSLVGSDGDFFVRYRVNPLISNERDAGAPVVVETNPNVRNLLGRIEGQVRFGVMVTDFTRIAPGAAHRANGGYLVLDAEEVLTRPLAWQTLKRTLRTRELRPVDPAAELGLSVTESLEPEPIPARIKVLLVGQPRTFYMLQQLDPEFAELFKVKVDFAPDVDRTSETEQAYASFVAGRCREMDLPPFDASAVAAIIDEASREAGDQRKLTTRMREIIDVMQESAHAVGSRNDPIVRRDEVVAALRSRERRNRRPHRQMLELIERGILSFTPEGEQIGQLYGIGLLSLGERPIGRPIRVMASAFMGTGGVINIEREAALSGPIHSKGFLVLSGYLGRRFARTHPLVLSASLSFDQMYEEVEGDSASVAELYGLMSAIGSIPLRQDIAVTGALNQEGLVLPVGGVSDKVEGFFEACDRKGLTGTQGVVVPTANLDNLVLRERVRTAAAEGRFHVWAIERVEDGWPILSGLEAGDETDDGTYPDGSVHALVAEQLAAWYDEAARRPPEGRTPDAATSNGGGPDG